MADNHSGATFGVHSDFAFLAVLTLLADSQIVVELDVVGHEAVAISFSSNHQVAIVRIVFAISIGSRISDCRMGFVIHRDYGTLAGGGSSVVDGCADFSQLVFRSGTAADVFRIRYIPVRVAKTYGIAAIYRMVALVGGQFRIGKMTNRSRPGF